jgi:hypothetical protein
MTRPILAAVMALVLLSITVARAQNPAPTDSGAVVTPHAAPAPCLIVKHKGTVGRRLLFTALIGVPIAPGAKYDYVDNINVPGTKLAYNGKELQALQAKGVHVIVLNNKYATSDLESAHKSCQETAPTVDKP